MTWHDGKLYVEQWMIRALIIGALGVEFGLILYAMYGPQGAGAELAYAGSVVWPMAMAGSGFVLRTDDPELVMRAGTEGFCTACGSDQLHSEAPGVYECRGCGYFGGPKLAAHQQQQRQGSFATMSPDKRWASALDDLELAERAFAQAGPLLRDGARALASQARHRSGDHDVETIPSLERGTALFVTANRHASDAQAKLGEDLGIPTTVNPDGGPGADATAADYRLAVVQQARRRLANRSPS